MNGLKHGPLVAAAIYCVAVGALISDARPALPPDITNSLALRQMVFLSSLTSPDAPAGDNPAAIGGNLSDLLEETARKPLATDQDRLRGAALAIFERAPHLVPLFLAPIADTDPLATALVAWAFDPTAKSTPEVLDLAHLSSMNDTLRNAVVAAMADRAGLPDEAAAARETIRTRWEMTVVLGSVLGLLFMAFLVTGGILWFRSGRYTAGTAPAERPAWDGLLAPLRVIVFFLAIYLTVGTLAPRLMDALDVTMSMPLLAMATYLVTGSAGLILIQAVGRQSPHDRFADLSGLSNTCRRKGLGRTLGWSIGGYAMLLPMVMAVSVMSSALFGDSGAPFDNPVAVFLVTDPDSSTTVLLLFSVAILAPIFEEPLFRGYIYGRLRRYFSVPGAAAISGLLFGLVHFSLSNSLPLAAIGFTLAIVYERTQNLATPMMIHAAWNLGTAIVLLGMFA